MLIKTEEKILSRNKTWKETKVISFLLLLFSTSFVFMRNSIYRNRNKKNFITQHHPDAVCERSIDFVREIRIFIKCSEHSVSR